MRKLCYLTQPWKSFCELKGRGQNCWQRAESVGLEFGVWHFPARAVGQEESLAVLERAWFSHTTYRGQAVILMRPLGRGAMAWGLLTQSTCLISRSCQGQLEGQVTSPESYCAGTDEFSPDCWLSQSLCSILSMLEVPNVHRFKIAWKGIRSEI